MVPTLQIGQRVLVNRIGERFSTPDVGDIVVFHPPDGRRGGRHVRREPAAGRPGLPKPTPQRADVNFIKRVVAGPGDRIRIDNGQVDPQRQARRRSRSPSRAAAARLRLSRRGHRFRPVTTS